MNQLRGDIPAYPGPPDRAQWEREHGAKPYPLPDVEARFANQARATIARDYSTIESDKAIGEQVRLDHICERVKYAAMEVSRPPADSADSHPACPSGREEAQAGRLRAESGGTPNLLRETDLVFFDEKDGNFWVYPEGPYPIISHALWAAAQDCDSVKVAAKEHTPDLIEELRRAGYEIREIEDESGTQEPRK